MKTLTPEIMDRAVILINQLREDDDLDEDAISDVVDELYQLLPDPEFMGYTVDHEPELSAEEVVKRAFLYKPILL